MQSVCWPDMNFNPVAIKRLDALNQQLCRVRHTRDQQHASSSVNQIAAAEKNIQKLTKEWPHSVGV